MLSVFFKLKQYRDCLIRAGMGEKLLSLDTDAKAKGKNALDFSIGRGYDSEGIDISGGERQKIALARALYKDAPFVILDEPTAALDPIAEAAVYEDFNKITEDKTAVFISHRLSSCRFCDTIAVFDKGQLVQEGSHDTLVAVNDGKYAELWRAQAQYYKTWNKYVFGVAAENTGVQERFVEDELAGIVGYSSYTLEIKTS